ncbi:MAG: hypothetical protein J6K55_05995 [Clostridia bacterium]|nr:hypothetical protein [Clostridia bacterium]
MKRAILLLLVLVMLTGTACAGEFLYSTASVTDSASTSSLYDNFYASGELDAPTPGVAEGIIPQGIAYLPQEDWLLFSGYRSDGGHSALIAVDRKSNEVVKEVYLINMDESVYTGHAGGVCVTEKNIFISNASKLYRISLETFRALPPASECAFEEEIPVPVNASYCAYAEGILWVGEFQYGGEYKTDASHKVKSKDGRFKAWTCGYLLDQNAENEIKAEAFAGSVITPDYILSVTERIQGMTVSRDQIYLSQSYGRKNASLLWRYSNVLGNAPDAEAEINGKTIPIWCLDSGVKTGALSAPPMTEGLVTIGDEVYVLFESAAQKYMDPKNPSVNPIDRVFRLTGF